MFRQLTMHHRRTFLGSGGLAWSLSSLDREGFQFHWDCPLLETEQR